jgi:hypothetical protein
MLSFIDSLGGFPINEGESWNASQFNKSELFERFPHILLEFFLMQFKVSRISSDNELTRLVVSFIILIL